MSFQIKNSILTYVAGSFLLFNSGCPLLIPAMMEATGANRYYRLVEKAERENKIEEDNLEKQLAKNVTNDEYNKMRLEQTFSETGTRLTAYSKKDENLDDLERSLESIRGDVVEPRSEAIEEYNRAEVLGHLYYDLKRLRYLRESFGSYIEICSGNYFTANEDNIRRAFSELREMRLRMERYKDSSNVVSVLKEVDETIQCAESYFNYLKEARGGNRRRN